MAETFHAFNATGLFNFITSPRFKLPRYDDRERRFSPFSVVPFVPDEQGTFFLGYLQVARGKEVTKPEDRIYAIRSLSSSAFRASVPVEYSEEVDGYLEMYKTATKVLLHLRGSHRILDGTNSFSKHPKLPSWCPDFNTPSEEGYLEPMHSFGVRYKRLVKGDTEDPNLLRLAGAKLDTVACVVDSSCWSRITSENWPTGQLFGVNDAGARELRWLVACWRLVQNTLDSDD